MTVKLHIQDEHGQPIYEDDGTEVIVDLDDETYDFYEQQAKARNITTEEMFRQTFTQFLNDLYK